MRRRRFVVAGLALAGWLAGVRAGGLGAGGTERGQGSDAYQAVLYPQGLPSRADPFSGRTETVAFEVHASVELPELGALALVYSERLGARGSDGAYNVYLGLLTREGGTLRKRAAMELTEFIPVSLEFPGHCLSVDAGLDALHLRGRPAVHVNLWGVLSGTGSISGASDLVFGFGAEDRPELLLALRGSSTFSRAGLGHYEFKDARLVLAMARDGRPWLVVRTRSVSQAQGRAPREQASVASYAFGERAFEPEALGAEELSALEASGRALSRSRNLASEPPGN